MSPHWTEGCITPSRKVNHMIRILATDEPGALAITVDGRFVGEYSKEVETCVQLALEEHKRVRLFLRDVTDIDDIGRSLLVRLASQGVELSASGVYSAYVVASLGK